MALDIIKKRLDDIKGKALFRSTRVVDGVGARIKISGRPYMLLCSNNYLGLADHQYLRAAAEDAATEYGTSSGASRLVSGTQFLHEKLEHEIADWKNTESALLFNSGYAANTGVIAAIAGRGDIIFSDRLNHASIVDGALLSGARFIRYPHNDIAALEMLLQKHQTSGVRLIVTDGVFSMDGDMAPLSELSVLTEKYDALLMVDDAHGGGILGDEGRGSVDVQAVTDRVHLLVGTFGKALGSFGAFVATSALLRDYLVNRSRSLVFSTSLPPAVLAASLAAIRIIRSEEGLLLRRKLSDNISVFRSVLLSGGIKTNTEMTPILPVHVGDAALAMEFSARLMEAGYFLQGIRPPTVPPGTSRLRCTIMATHNTDDLERAAGAIISNAKLLGVC